LASIRRAERGLKTEARKAQSLEELSEIARGDSTELTYDTLEDIAGGILSDDVRVGFACGK